MIFKIQSSPEIILKSIPAKIKLKELELLKDLWVWGGDVRVFLGGGILDKVHNFIVNMQLC